jgi:DNA-binding NtrC family response regulator
LVRKLLYIARMAFSILVVDQHPATVARVVQPLRHAGYDVTGATTFEDAKRHMAMRPPHLLIAAQRLGLFNGLHLALCARHDHPDTAAIVTAEERDPTLEAEAITCGASCAPAPLSSADVLALVARAFAARPM